LVSIGAVKADKSGLVMSNPYFKDVSKLKSVDVYRVLNLFDVRSHAVGHAIKKLLCAGLRGAKDYEQDLREAKASIERELAMMDEENKNDVR